MIWVLERVNKLSQAQIVPAIEGLLSSTELVIEEAERVGEALVQYAMGKAGFSDHVILGAARSTKCIAPVTFDQALAESNVAQMLGWLPLMALIQS